MAERDNENRCLCKNTVQHSTDNLYTKYKSFFMVIIRNTLIHYYSCHYL